MSDEKALSTRRPPRVSRSGETGKESVWDYPRPPALEATGRHLVVRFNGEVIADTTGAYRVLETSHPPTYYIPPEDVREDLLDPAPGLSLCEWKGRACYWSVSVGSETAYRAVWGYPSPTERFKPIAGYYAFYPSLVDAEIDGEAVASQEGDFYGGWITSDLEGPFKGGPGSLGW